MSVINSMPYWLQVVTPFYLQPWGFFGQNVNITDPAIIAAINASAFASRCAQVTNPDYQRAAGVVAPPVGTQAITANSQTVNVVEQGKIFLSSALGSGITGIVLQKGAVDGQELTLFNNATVSVTFAAAGTSNVQGGTGVSMATLTAKKFMWEANTSLWWPC